jgi:alkylation response protein AidB-like acyl-CoA dehydrogenase
MYLALSDEQEFLADAASGILARHPTLTSARAALDGDPPLSLWEAACEAGWSGVLSAEEAGGAGLGLYEAMLVLESCGNALADARLLGHLPACALLDAAGADLELREALAAGERRAALIDGALGYRGSPLRARFEGDLVHLSGTVAGVLDAPDADVLVVVASDLTGRLVAALVEDAPGAVRIESARSYDATRSLGGVTLDGTVGRVLEVSDKIAAQGRSIQRALLAAESVGAANACLNMARDYAVDRIAFGRAIGSYQAIKHKLVEMLRRIELARSLLRYAGDAWAERPVELSLAANAARVSSTKALDHAAPENIFIHGGIGATWEHDAQLYYRRAEVSRRLAGGAEAAADAVAGELFAWRRPHNHNSNGSE